MHPLIFKPVYRRYLWGGRRFATMLGRQLPPGEDYAESWDLVDRGSEQSVVATGPLAGWTLGDLVRRHGRELLGRHAPLPAFPLLFKFLDASHDLSVQVHPDDARAARLSPSDKGKTEAWYVIDAAPGSRIYAGLQPGTTREHLTEALRAGQCANVLHSFEPQAGNCVLIPAGTVHAIGGGLMVAEIQQSSDVTYRLHDWNRIGHDGKPRALHIEAGLEAVSHFEPVTPVTPMATDDSAARRLVECPYFLLDEVLVSDRWTIRGEGRCHFLVVLSNGILLDPRWRLPELTRGSCVLIPAEAGDQSLIATNQDGMPTKLLHVRIP